MARFGREPIAAVFPDLMDCDSKLTTRKTACSIAASWLWPKIPIATFGLAPTAAEPSAFAMADLLNSRRLRDSRLTTLCKYSSAAIGPFGSRRLAGLQACA